MKKEIFIRESHKFLQLSKELMESAKIQRDTVVFLSNESDKLINILDDRSAYCQEKNEAGKQLEFILHKMGLELKEIDRMEKKVNQCQKDVEDLYRQRDVEGLD